MPQGIITRLWSTDAILALVEPQTKRLIRRATTGSGIGGATINHDDLDGFVADEHIDWTASADDLLTSGTIGISNADEGNTGKLRRRCVRELLTLSGATTTTTTISVPSGARLLAIGMNIDTEVVTTEIGVNTWGAVFDGGSSTVIVAAESEIVNTKVNFIVPDEIVSGTTQVQFAPTGGTFTAGVIEILVWYEELISLANV